MVLTACANPKMYGWIEVCPLPPLTPTNIVCCGILTEGESLSTAEHLVLTSSDQLRFLSKIQFLFVAKQAALMSFLSVV
jgi:hypothetical protein